MAKFINIHELRSDDGIASLMRRQPRSPGRPLGGNFEEPFAEDGEDDGFSEPVVETTTAPEPEVDQPALTREDITWIKSRVSTDSIRSAKALVSGGLAKGMIVLKNEKTIKTRETFDELCALMDAP